MKLLNFIYNDLRSIAEYKMPRHLDADDLCQEMARKAWENKDRIEAMPDIEQRHFIVRCMHNYITDRHREIQKKRKDLTGYKPYCKQPPEAYGIMGMKEVRKALEGKQQHDQLLDFAAGYSIQEITEMRGITESCALGRNRYARRYLNKQLNQ